MSRVLVVSDTHCPGMRAGYVEFLKKIANKHSIDRVVHIGDVVDWASISFHEKSAALSNAGAEFALALKQVKKLYRAFPKADVLIGNHDALTERQANQVGLPVEVLKNFSDLWEVPGWKAHPRFSKIEIDGVIYSHGEAGKGGQDAALKQARENFRSTVIGHFHSQGGCNWAANKDTRFFGMSVGAGIDDNLLAFEYGRKIAAKSVLGCGVVLGGKQAYFEPWLLPNRK